MESCCQGGLRRPCKQAQASCPHAGWRVGRGEGGLYPSDTHTVLRLHSLSLGMKWVLLSWVLRCGD